MPLFRALGPGEEDTVNAEGWPGLLTPELSDDDERLLTIQAIVFYKDEFNDSHKSSLCPTYIRGGASFFSEGSYSF